MQLYDQFNRPIRQTKKPEQRPLAAAPILDTWREYVTSGLTPQKLATIFKQADAGDVSSQSELYDQIEEKDGHLVGESGKRKNAILDVEFKIRPASEDTRDVKVAEFVEGWLQNLTDFEDILVAMQDAVGKGFSAMELGWDVTEGQALPTGFDFIEQKRFLFTDHTGYLRKTPLLLSDDESMGAEIPAWKILFHRYGGKSGHPTRSGIYRVCAWMYLFKNYAIKDWVVFCEVYGMPLRLGKYDSGASSDDKDALITAISSLGSDAAGIISKSTEIEFVEAAKGTASADLWKNLAQFTNGEMSKALLGQTLTAEVGDKGSYAAAKTHNEVRLDLAKADTKAVAATIRHQLIRPIVGFNFGWDTLTPKYQPIWEEAENLKEKAEWITSLLDRNVIMPVSFVRNEFNIPEPEGDEPVVGERQAAPEITAKKVIAKNTAKAHKDLADIYTDRIEDNKANLLDDLIEPVRNLIMTAKSFEEIRDGLIELGQDMDVSEIGNLMQRAFTAAELAGRYEVNNAG